MDIWKPQREEAVKLDTGLLYLKHDMPKCPGHMHLMVWKPKAKRPYINHRLKIGEVDRWIAEANQALIDHKKEVVGRREKAKPTTEKMKSIEIGQIFYSSWGYDQTNIDFYQVTSIKNATVGIRPIGSTLIKDTSWASGQVMPIKDKFIGQEVIKRPNFGCDKVYITVSSCASAWIWDGKPKNCSWWA